MRRPKRKALNWLFFTLGNLPMLSKLGTPKAQNDTRLYALQKGKGKRKHKRNNYTPPRRNK